MHLPSSVRLELGMPPPCPVTNKPPAGPHPRTPFRQVDDAKTEQITTDGCRALWLASHPVRLAGQALLTLQQCHNLPSRPCVRTSFLDSHRHSPQQSTLLLSDCKGTHCFFFFFAVPTTTMTVVDHLPLYYTSLPSVPDNRQDHFTLGKTIAKCYTRQIILGKYFIDNVFFNKCFFGHSTKILLNVEKHSTN